MTRGRIGLRGKLALSIAAIVIAAFAITFYAVYQVTGSQLRSRIDHDLRLDADSLAGAVRRANGSPIAALATAQRYIAAQPFGPSATLLIVTVPGAGTVSNEPELLGARAETSEPAHDAKEEAHETRSLLGAPTGYSDVKLQDAGNVRLLTVRQRVGGESATVRAGEPLQSVTRAQSEVEKTFLLIGALTLAAALAASFIVATRTTAPLRRMARVATAVDGGDLTHRTGERGTGDEIQLLAQAFDHMLDRLEDAFSRQREFVSDASHELRTPLTAIRGQLEVLAREPNPSQQRIREVEQIATQEISRMQRLVDDLLALAKLDEGLKPAPTEIDVSEFLRRQVQTQASGNGYVEFAGAPKGTIRADADQIAQVVGNLLRNAREHTGNGGTVRLSAEGYPGHLQVNVDDQGPGIPADQRARVFDRFHRLESSRTRRTGGSGLGLAIARAVVEAHGGRIWAADSPLGGARISFELPGFRSGAISPESRHASR